MNKKVISLLICSIIVFVSSNPVDRADDGGKQTHGSHLSYTEHLKAVGPIVNTLASVTSQQIDETHANKSEVPSVATADTNSSSIVPSSVPSAPDNATNPSGNNDTTTETSTKPTTTTPTQPTPPPSPANTTTSVTTTTITPPTTTNTLPTTTTITPPTTTPPTVPTTTVTPETTKDPTTITPSTTTTAPAATTTVPAPSKDRRFDGPSFIGGIVLSLGIMAIGFVAFKFYKARTERNYHTL